MLKSIALSALALAFGGVAAFAGDEVKELTIADKAPPLEISHWLKGEEVAEFEPGKVYVVEFWATWCPPCRASMPHLSELQAEYDDYGVTFIGISDEKLQTVVEFLLKDDWNEKTQYTLATDPDRSVYTAYMTASGNGGIPTAFVVGKDGRVEWIGIGHPMGMDEPLRAIVQGTWDREAFKAEWEPKMAARREAMRERLKLEAAINAKDWSTATQIVEGWIEKDPENPGYKFQKFTLLLKRMNQPEQAYAFGREMIQDHWEDAQFLNQAAWFVVDDKGVQRRDLEFAMKAAKRASELRDHEDAAILDTLARVYYEQGKLEQAIEWQRKAVEQAEGPMAEDLRNALDKYEAEADTR